MNSSKIPGTDLDFGSGGWMSRSCPIGWSNVFAQPLSCLGLTKASEGEKTGSWLYHPWAPYPSIEQCQSMLLLLSDSFLFHSLTTLTTESTTKNNEKLELKFSELLLSSLLLITYLRQAGTDSSSQDSQSSRFSTHTHTP